MLTWTEHRPMLEGRYWFRRKHYGDPGIVMVYQDADNRWFAGPKPLFDLVGKFEWAGPIPEPLEPDQCEHRVQHGEYCETCNREYKLAAADPENGCEFTEEQGSRLCP